MPGFVSSARQLKENNFAKKRGMGKKLFSSVRAIMKDEHVNLIAGDFKGVGRTCGNNSLQTSTLEETFIDNGCPIATGPSPTFVVGAILGEWALCVFIVPPSSQDVQKVHFVTQGIHDLPRSP